MEKNKQHPIIYLRKEYSSENIIEWSHKKLSNVIYGNMHSNIIQQLNQQPKETQLKTAALLGTLVTLLVLSRRHILQLANAHPANGTLAQEKKTNKGHDPPNVFVLNDRVIFAAVGISKIEEPFYEGDPKPSLCTVSSGIIEHDKVPNKEANPVEEESHDERNEKRAVVSDCETINVQFVVFVIFRQIEEGVDHSPAFFILFCLFHIFVGWKSGRCFIRR